MSTLTWSLWVPRGGTTSSWNRQCTNYNRVCRNSRLHWFMYEYENCTTHTMTTVARLAPLVYEMVTRGGATDSWNMKMQGGATSSWNSTVWATTMSTVTEVAPLIHEIWKCKVAQLALEIAQYEPQRCLRSPEVAYVSQITFSNRYSAAICNTERASDKRNNKCYFKR